MKKLLFGVVIRLALGLVCWGVAQAASNESVAPLHTRTYAQMLSAGEIRVAVPDDPSLYFTLNNQRYGFAIEVAHALELWISKATVKQKKQKLLRVVLVPSTREDLYSKLRKGEADLVLTNRSVTAEAGNPKGLRTLATTKTPQEVLVMGRHVVGFKGLDSLSGQTVLTRRSSSLEKALQMFSDASVSQNKTAIEFKTVASAQLGAEEDALAMLDQGSASFAIVSDWKASLWQSVYRNIQINSDVSADDANGLVWVARRNCADLLKEVTRFEASGYEALAKQRFKQSYLRLVNSK